MAEKKKIVDPVASDKTANCRVICVGSLMTTMHIVYPLIKCLNKLGTVNLVTEDKAFLALSSNHSADYELGNVRVRVVECVSVLDSVELGIEDYDFSVLTITEFLPPLDVDKYVFLSAREFYRQQLMAVDNRKTPIFSINRSSLLTQKEKEVQKNTRFVNETHFQIGNFMVYDKMLYQLTSLRKLNVDIPSQIAVFITELLNGYKGAAKKDIQTFLKGDDF